MSDPRLRRSGGGVSSLGLRLVWCSKDRRGLLGGGVAARLNEVSDGIAVEHGWEIVAGEVMPDQVHIFVRVHPTGSPGEVARRFKGRTARVVGAGFARPGGRRVLWSKSQVAKSVGYLSEQTARRYVEYQWLAA